MRYADNKDTVCNRLKRQPLLLAEASLSRVDYGRELIGQLLPHRPPMAFIHGITAVDLPNLMIEAVSHVAADDPVFAGHFPENPIYPGVHQIEIMGQAALCLTHFVRRQSVAVSADTRPIGCVFTRVHNAGFLRLIRPGTTLTVRAQVLEHDELMGLMAAQILVDGQICAHAVLEAHFLNEGV